MKGDKAWRTRNMTIHMHSFKYKAEQCFKWTGCCWAAKIGQDGKKDIHYTFDSSQKFYLQISHTRKWIDRINMHEHENMDNIASEPSKREKNYIRNLNFSEVSLFEASLHVGIEITGFKMCIFNGTWHLESSVFYVWRLRILCKSSAKSSGYTFCIWNRKFVNNLKHFEITVLKEAFPINSILFFLYWNVRSNGK